MEFLNAGKRFRGMRPKIDHNNNFCKTIFDSFKNPKFNPYLSANMNIPNYYFPISTRVSIPLDLRFFHRFDKIRRKFRQERKSPVLLGHFKTKFHVDSTG